MSQSDAAWRKEMNAAYDVARAKTDARSEARRVARSQEVLRIAAFRERLLRFVRWRYALILSAAVLFAFVLLLVVARNARAEPPQRGLIVELLGPVAVLSPGERTPSSWFQGNNALDLSSGNGDLDRAAFICNKHVADGSPGMTHSGRTFTPEFQLYFHRTQPSRLKRDQEDKEFLDSFSREFP